MRKFKRIVLEFIILVILGILISAPLVYAGYWYWLSEKFAVAIEVGDVTETQNRQQQLYKFYDIFKNYKITRLIDKFVFQDVLWNESVLLYQNGDYDSLFTKIDGIKGSKYSLLRGDVYFRKAVLEDNKNQEEVWLDRAKDEYLAAVEDDPDNFDAKFNYELMSDLQARQKAVAKQRKKLGLDSQPQPGKQKGPAKPIPARPYKIEDIQRMHGSTDLKKEG